MLQLQFLKIFFQKPATGNPEFLKNLGIKSKLRAPTITSVVICYLWLQLFNPHRCRIAVWAVCGLSTWYYWNEPIAYHLAAMPRLYITLTRHNYPIYQWSSTLGSGRLQILLRFSRMLFLADVALAVLAPRLCLTMNRCPRFWSVVHFPDCIFQLQSCPWSDIVHPCCFQSSSFPIPRRGPWNNDFFPDLSSPRMMWLKYLKFLVNVCWRLPAPRPTNLSHNVGYKNVNVHNYTYNTQIKKT